MCRCPQRQGHRDGVAANRPVGALGAILRTGRLPRGGSTDPPGRRSGALYAWLMLADWPAGRRAAVSAVYCLCVAVLVITVLIGLSTQYWMRVPQAILAAVGAFGLIGLVVA